MEGSLKRSDFCNTHLGDMDSGEKARISVATLLG